MSRILRIMHKAKNTKPVYQTQKSAIKQVQEEKVAYVPSFVNWSVRTAKSARITWKGRKI